MLPALALLAAAAAAPCTSAMSRAALQQRLAAAELAFDSLDEAGLAAGLADARATLLCLGEPLTSDESARWLRLEGLAAFLAGDGDLAALAFASARQLQPEAPVRRDGVPADHPLAEAYQRLAAPPCGARPLPDLGGPARWNGGEIWFPCLPGALQILDGQGRPTRTLMLAAGDEPLPAPPPTFPVEPPPPDPVFAGVPAAPEATPAAGHASRWLAGSAAGALIGSAALYTVSWHRRERFWEEPAEEEALRALRGQVNLCWGAATGVGAIGLGLGVGALVVGRW
jgi:hypothetical protein